MTATIDQFRALVKTLDETAAACDVELMGREDIGGPMKEIAAYLRAFSDLPAAISKLEAEKARVEARLPGRVAAAKAARHQIATLETGLGKLRIALAHNEEAAASEGTVNVTVTSPLAAGFPVSRQARVEELRSEIGAVEAEMAGKREALKKAERALKADQTRQRNLAAGIAGIECELGAHSARLTEVAKLVRKTTHYLKNRQEKRDRNRAVKAVKQAPIEVVEATPVETKAAVTDEDIRKMAEMENFPINGPEDLEFARQYFRN